MGVSHNSVISKNTQHLNIPGISSVIINGERAIRIEAMAKRFITNKYINCLHNICYYWNNSYYILDTLIGHVVIKQRDDYSMEWTLTDTSLAWLFKKMHLNKCEDGYVSHIPCGFWKPIATLFGKKSETLRKLVYNKFTFGGKSQDIGILNTILNENNINLCA